MSVCKKSLDSVKFGSFLYSDGSVSGFHESVIDNYGQQCPVYVYHGNLRSYGTRGLCFTVPVELSSLFDVDRKTHLWFVELFYANEEHVGPKHIFHKFMRTVSGRDCIPLPMELVNVVEDVPWTIVISPLNKYMLKQFDGFVYPDVVVKQSVFDFYTMLGI